jgi:hypothetical protein
MFLHLRDNPLLCERKLTSSRKRKTRSWITQEEKALVDVMWANISVVCKAIATLVELCWLHVAGLSLSPVDDRIMYKNIIATADEGKRPGQTSPEELEESEGWSCRGFCATI